MQLDEVSSWDAKLRAKALRKLRRDSGTEHTYADHTAAELIEDLLLYQAELELQNEELRDLRENLEEQNRFQHLYHELAPIGMLICDRHGVIQELNLLASELLRLPRNQLRPAGRHLSALLLDTYVPAWLKHLDKAFASRQRQVVEVVLRRSDGPTRWIQIHSVSRQERELRPYCLCSLVDITAQKEAEAALHTAAQEARSAEQQTAVALRQAAESKGLAEAASRAKSQFLANISHELRTPLNAVRGFVNLLGQVELEPLPRSYLSHIDTSVGHLVELLDDLLSYAQLDAGTDVTRSKPLDLLTVVASIEGRFRHLAQRKALRFDLQTDNRLPDRIMGDRSKITTILQHLVSNAIKFTNQGEVTLKVRLISEEDDAIRVEFAVTDTGIGIAKEKTQAIFAPFSQADNSDTRVYGGAGLGLAITRRLVELLDGTLTVDSRLGQGSTFTVVLPLRAAPASDAQGDGELFQGKPQPWAGMSVLIVEDDPTNALLLKELLERMHLRVEAAINGQEALKAIDGQSFALIFMDCQMPVLDGYEATRRIREHFTDDSQPVIIALTACAQAEDRKRCIEAGMDDFISKPFQIRDIVHSLQKWLFPRSA